MRVNSLHPLLLDMKREVVVYCVRGSVAYLAFDGAIGNAVDENTLSVLCLRMEHHCCHRVVFALYCDDELFAFVLIDC